MSNIVRTHDFEHHKSEIRSFANNVPRDLRLSEFKTERKFWKLSLGEHKVTGAEMNEFVEEVRNVLIENNERTRNVIREFQVVYNAFEALDRDYIQGILVAIESAENASRQALEAQEDIEKVIDAQVKTVRKLKYQHRGSFAPYWIAGGALLISAVHLILDFLGII